MILKFPEDTDKALQQWIHDNYGRDSGLLREEYYVSIDPESNADVFMGCGSVIQIIVKFPPGHPRFYDCLKSVFRNPELKKLRRSKALVRKADAERWYSLSFTNMDKALPLLKRGESYHSAMRTQLLTQLRAVDTKSGREVVLTIENGNGFNAMEEAARLLYGEKF